MACTFFAAGYDASGLPLEIEAKRKARHFFLVPILPPTEEYRLFSRELHVDPKTDGFFSTNPAKQFPKVATVGDEIDGCPIKVITVDLGMLINCDEEREED